MPTKSIRVRSLGILIVIAALLSGCNSGASTGAPNNPSPKRYTFNGKVISVDKKAGTANINNEPIPGFMDAMIMPYTIKPAAMFDQLKPGDSITADVVVESDKYWLENVRITDHSAPAKM